MLRIGLTGGIASGKSTLGEGLRERGIPVIDADEVSQALMQPGEPGYQAAVAHFGSDILDSRKHIDRSALRRLVFKNPDQRKWLEQMLHPLIRQRIEQTADSLDSELVFILVPLLFESGFDEIVDTTVAIDCPRDVQMQRLMERDGIDQALAERMIDAQLDNRQRLERADQSICNDGQHPLGEQMDRLLQQLAEQTATKPVASS